MPNDLQQNPVPSNTLTTLSNNSLTTNAPPLPAYMQISQATSLLKVSAYELQDEVMASLWAALMDIYGKKFAEQYGEFLNANGQMTSTVKMWAQALSHIPPERLERGLRACLERDSPWPVMLPEFVAMCAKKPWE